MLAVTQQSMWNVVEPLTEEKRREVYNFAVKLREPESLMESSMETSMKDEFAEYKALMKQSQEWAKEVGLTPEDITRAIRSVRQRNRGYENCN